MKAWWKIEADFLTVYISLNKQFFYALVKKEGEGYYFQGSASKL